MDGMSKFSFKLILIITLILIAVSEDVRNVDAIGFSITEYVQVGESRVIVNRTDGGATTSLGIIVRHEKEILPGILLARNFIGNIRDTKLNSKFKMAFC
ncbi:MAG: hypothetical protein ACLKAK_10265 [Alkaliphilus sp.]